MKLALFILLSLVTQVALAAPKLCSEEQKLNVMKSFLTSFAKARGVSITKFAKSRFLPEPYGDNYGGALQGYARVSDPYWNPYDGSRPSTIVYYERYLIDVDPSCKPVRMNFEEYVQENAAF